MKKGVEVVFDFSKESLIEAMTPFAFAIGIVAVCVVLLAIFAVLSSKSGSLRLDLVEINVQMAAGKLWFTPDRLSRLHRFRADPFFVELACRHLVEIGTLIETESKRTGRTFYRLASAN